MLRPLVEQFVSEAVALAPVNSELRTSFKHHERYNKFIDHITEEASRLPDHLVTHDKLQTVCTEFTHLWLKLVEQMADERAMSEAAKQAIRDKAQLAAKQESIVNDMNEGKEIDAERITEVIDG